MDLDFYVRVRTCEKLENSLNFRSWAGSSRVRQASLGQQIGQVYTVKVPWSQHRARDATDLMQVVDF